MVNRIDAADNLDDRTPLQAGTTQHNNHREALPAAFAPSAATAAILPTLATRRLFLMPLVCNWSIGHKQALVLNSLRQTVKVTQALQASVGTFKVG